MRTSRIGITLEQVIIRCSAVLVTTRRDGVWLRESRVYQQDKFTRCESHPEFIGMTFCGDAIDDATIAALSAASTLEQCDEPSTRNFPHCWPRKKRKKNFTGVSGVMWQQSNINRTRHIHLPAQREERKVFQTRVESQSLSETFGGFSGFSITLAIQGETISQLSAWYLTLPHKWSRMKQNSMESPFFLYYATGKNDVFLCAVLAIKYEYILC